MGRALGAILDLRRCGKIIRLRNGWVLGGDFVVSAGFWIPSLTFTAILSLFIIFAKLCGVTTPRTNNVLEARFMDKANGVQTMEPIGFGAWCW